MLARLANHGPPLAVRLQGIDTWCDFLLLACSQGFELGAKIGRGTLVPIRAANNDIFFLGPFLLM